MPRSVLIAEAQSPLAGALLGTLETPSRVRSAGEVGAEPGDLWFLAGAGGTCAAPRQVLAAVERPGVTGINYVVTAGRMPGGETDLCERELVEVCERKGLPWRIFVVPSLLGGRAPGPAPAAFHGPAPVGGTSAERDGLLGFLDTLHALLGEVAERDPDHLAAVPLWVPCPPDAVVRPVGAERAAALMAAVADRSGTSGERHHIGPVASATAGGLIRLIGEVYGVRLEHAADGDGLTPLSRRLADRLALLAPFSCAEPDSAFRRSHELAGLDPDDTVLNPVDLRTRLSVISTEQRAVTRAGLGRAERVWSVLREAACEAGGAPLTYYDAGPAAPMREPLVLLNALGQGLTFWSRLIDALLPDHRIIVWEPRGHDEAPRTGDQARDLSAVLEAAGVGSCHLIGWCTGPKVSLEFYRRRPSAVRSMVFLNGSFRLDGQDAGLDTAYERNLGFLCRSVEGRPESAGTLMRLFTSPDDTPQDADAPVADVLDRASPLLSDAVRAPFTDERHLLSYARQLSDFWRDDALRDAAHVDVPLLFIGADRDDVVSPRRFRRAAARFSRSRYEQVPGSGHYALFDRPAVIARLIRQFVRASHPDAE